MPEPVLRERVGAKRDLLTNDLGLLEGERENLSHKLNIIDKKLVEIEEIRKDIP